jgi:truncated hemoglobin YjbI
VSPDPKAVAAVRAVGADLRRRFAEEAARAHTRDRLDGPGDERKRRILEGNLWADLTRLATVNLLPQGAFATIQNRLVSVQTCKTFDERKLADCVICRDCGYRPRPSAGPTAKALLENVEVELRRLRDEWVRTLLDALRENEVREQVALLDPADRETVSGFIQTGELPSPVTDDFVRALNQVFERFEVRRVRPDEVWRALFPERVPSTPQQVRQRLERFLGGISTGVPEEKVRIVPMTEEEQA